MNPLPTTATASSGVYQELYESLLHSGFGQVISIHASSLLSGIYNAASLAAQAFAQRVHVIDSQYVSMGLGFQVLAAAEAANTSTHEDILHMLEGLRKRMRLIAMLDTLEFVRRGGRISWARARMGDLLHIKPFIEIRMGQLVRMGETRTRHKGVARLLEMLSGLGPLERLAVLHTNAEADARAFLENLQPDLPTLPLVINVTTVIGTHAGPNALGFAAVVRW
jgi:DegV family protein with EDD domain